jgi:hypothetical protein
MNWAQARNHADAPLRQQLGSNGTCCLCNQLRPGAFLLWHAMQCSEANNALHASQPLQRLIKQRQKFDLEGSCPAP